MPAEEALPSTTSTQARGCGGAERQTAVATAADDEAVAEDGEDEDSESWNTEGAVLAAARSQPSVCASSSRATPPVSSLQLPPVRMLRDDQLFFARVTAVAGRGGGACGGPGEAQYQVLVQGAVLSRSIQVQTSASLQQQQEQALAKALAAEPQRRARKVQTDWVAACAWMPPVVEKTVIYTRSVSRAGPCLGLGPLVGMSADPFPVIGLALQRRVARAPRPTSAPENRSQSPVPRSRPPPPAAHQKCFVDHPYGYPPPPTLSRHVPPVCFTLALFASSSSAATSLALQKRTRAARM